MRRFLRLYTLNIWTQLRNTLFFTSFCRLLSNSELLLEKNSFETTHLLLRRTHRIALSHKKISSNDENMFFREKKRMRVEKYTLSIIAIESLKKFSFQFIGPNESLPSGSAKRCDPRHEMNRFRYFLFHRRYRFYTIRYNSSGNDK